MTFDEVLAKRNEARGCRHELKRNDETSIAILNAEYNWGYWDAVITIMEQLKLKEITA
jgi:hypothetical protein